jgi:MerR family transcriptional regulator/heat shock protein HspR
MNQDFLDPVITIGTLAKKVGLSVSAIRKYEDEGLLISHRSESGHRLFAYEDIQRINTIQHLIKELGFNFEGIRRVQAMLPCWNVLPCEDSARENCAAFKGSDKPCWMTKDAHCSFQGNECRKCHVYRFGSIYTENIKNLLFYKENGSNQKDKVLKHLNNSS